MDIHIHTNDKYTIGQRVEMTIGYMVVFAEVTKIDGDVVHFNLIDKNGSSIKEVLFSGSQSSFSIGTASQ